MKSRKAVELMAKFATIALEDMGQGHLAQRIAPYRAGYTPQQRREIEHRLVEGELLGVVSTDALELGIDIGSLDAAICVTFPGTSPRCKQMWGRAGRRGRGLAVYVAGEDALDQFFCRHPDEFLDRPVEAAILDPRTSRSTPRTSSAPRTRARSTPPTTPRSARRGGTPPRCSSPPASCGSGPNGTLRPARDRRLPGRRRRRCAGRAATAS